MRRLFTVLLLLCTSTFIFAENIDSRQKDDFGIWQYYTASKGVNEKFSAFLRLEHRSKNHVKDLDCALFMPGVAFRVNGWFQMGFIYDFAIAQNKAHRNVLLPSITFSKKAGLWSMSLREMGQYVIESRSFLLRSKLDVRYKIPGSRLTPYIALEPYTNRNQVEYTDQSNFFKDMGERIGVVKSSNFLGMTYNVGRSTFDAGYIYYYLGLTAPGRHLINFGYTIRL